MKVSGDFYIGGRWVEAPSRRRLDVEDPSTEAVIGNVAVASGTDVEKAVAAANAVSLTFAGRSVNDRLALLERIIAVYEERSEQLAAMLSREMGAPLSLARSAQVRTGLVHLQTMADVMRRFPFEEARGHTLLRREPIGVCGLITPWNWPLNQIVCKVAPALAAGCTMILKPSELAPFSAMIFADILHDAGVPPGVFNLVNGDGATGAALASHPLIDMISFTGSTRAGILVAKAAADTVKRVHQELGGKSANILLPSADFPTAVAKGVEACFRNSGQSCNSPVRMLVPAARMEEAVQIAAESAARCRPGPPADPETVIGPVVSRVQYDRIQEFIASGIAEGAVLVAGGPGKPPGLEHGYYVRPTVFAGVTPDMRVAREEIFGPVLCLMAYSDEEDAIRVANDTLYGLAAYLQGEDRAAVNRMAAALRVGTIYVNQPQWDPEAPFGGYKRSGNGREYGEYGLEAFLELKAVVGSPIALKSRDAAAA